MIPAGPVRVTYERFIKAYVLPHRYLLGLPPLSTPLMMASSSPRRLQVWSLSRGTLARRQGLRVGLGRGGVLMDWTVAVDDLLTQRLCRCTACGRTATGWWGLWQGYGLIVAYVLCERCHVTDREP